MMTHTPPVSSLVEDLLHYVPTPLLLTDARGEKLLAWNEAFARQAALAPEAGRALADYLGASEAREWLVAWENPAWSGFLPDAKGEPVSVRLTRIHHDPKADLQVVGLSLTLDWLTAVCPDHFRSLMNNFAGALGFLDREGRLLVANRFLSDLADRPSARLVGLTPAEIFPDLFGRKVEELVRAALADGRQRTEALELDTTGRRALLRVILSPIAVRGEIVGADFAFQDITHIATLESTLASRDALLRAVSRASQQLLDDSRKFAENLDQVLAILGEGTGADRVYVWSIHSSPFPETEELHTSQLYEWSMGAEPQQDLDICVNRPVSEAIPTWIDTFRSGRCINSLVRDMHPREREQLEPQGIISIMVAPIMFHGTLWGFIGFDDCHSERTWAPAEENILRAAGTLVGTAIHNQAINADLRQAKTALEDTNRRLAQAVERAEQLAELADQANRAKSDFLANMSHEIRTPMNAILGVTHLVLETNLSAYQREMLEKADFAAQSLLRIINDILDFSKVEAGKMDIERLPFALDNVLAAVSDLVADRAAAKKLPLTVDLPSDLPTNYLGDPLRLSQVLTNLLTNAIKFTEEGFIRVAAEKTAEDDDTVTLLFRVTDTGIGLPPAARGRLFQPFCQADSSITRRYGGTGLGLVLCRKLVELMGGRIWCESEENRGSDFLFTVRLGRTLEAVLPSAPVIPVAQPAPGGGTAYRELAERLKGFRILLAEDNDLNQLVIKELLKKVGLSVAIAANGREAIERLEHEAFDLVLMDVQMPQMDGLTATRHLREQERFRALPIIAMTAHAMSGDREKSLAAGLDEHLTKPINPRELFSCLVRWREKLGPAPAPDPTSTEVSAIENPEALLAEMRHLIHEGRLSACRDLINRSRHLAWPESWRETISHFHEDFQACRFDRALSGLESLLSHRPEEATDG